MSEQRRLKYTASRVDIVNDFHEAIVGAMAKFAGKPDALAALGEIEDIAIWWANAPVLSHPPGEASEDAVEAVAQALRPFFSAAEKYQREHYEAARAAISSLPTPPEREALKIAREALNHLAYAPGEWKETARTALSRIRTTLLGEPQT